MKPCYDAVGWASDLQINRGELQRMFIDNTETAGPGSVKDAVMTAYPRYIVTRASGRVFQNDLIPIREPGMILNGLTAAGDGFVFEGMLSIQASDVAILGYRFRLGKRLTGVAPDKQKAIEIWPTTRQTALVERVFIGYCDSMFGIDEAAWSQGNSNGVPPKYITIFRCVGGWGLRDAGHSKGIHSMCATSNASGAEFVDYFQSAFLNCNHRMPNLHMAQGKRGNMINNVIANSYHGSNACSVSGDINIIGNHFVNMHGRVVVAVSDPGTRIYCADNYMDGRPVTATELGIDPQYLVDTPFPNHPSLDAPGVIIPGNEVLDFVLEVAGASPRDSIMTTLIESARLPGTGGLIDDEAAVGYPNAFSGLLAPDSDNDGIPDSAELLLGTDPNQDDAFDVSADGRLNIERYSDMLLGEDTGTPPDVDPPELKVIYPRPNTYIKGERWLRAEATDNVAVERVNFYLGDHILAEDISAPYAQFFDFAGIPRGKYTFRAVAFDVNGNSTEVSFPVRVNEPFRNQ